jgi:hypothetical protein
MTVKISGLQLRYIAFQHAVVIMIGVVIFYVDEIEFFDQFYPKLFCFWWP